MLYKIWQKQNKDR